MFMVKYCQRAQNQKIYEIYVADFAERKVGTKKFHNMSRVGSSIQTLSEKFRLKSTLDSKFTVPSRLSEEFKDGPPSTEAGHSGAIPFRIPRQLLTSRLYTLSKQIPALPGFL